MSLEAKKDFVDEVSARLEDDLTVSKMRVVQKSIVETMSGYSVEHNETEDNVQQSKELMDMFIRAKNTEGRSARTIKRYKYVMGRLVSYAKVPAGKITIGNIRAYFEFEKNRGISERTLEGYRNVFSSVFGWLHKEELIKKNPCANLAPVKCQKKVMYPFSQTDIELLKESCDNIRDKAIVCFLLATGARISEVCALNRDDINFQAMECKVVGKGNKERTVYIDTVAAMVLRRYFEQRKDNSPALFAGHGTERMTPQGIRVMLKRLEVKSGVSNVHPHRFRRTLATKLINHGMPIQNVKTILGHDKIDTTMQYVYIEQSNVKESYHRYY